MIRVDELRDKGLITKNNWEWYNGHFDFMYNSKTQELFSHDEVDGQLDFLCKVNNTPQLVDIVYATFNIDL